MKKHHQTFETLVRNQPFWGGKSLWWNWGSLYRGSPLFEFFWMKNANFGSIMTAQRDKVGSFKYAWPTLITDPCDLPIGYSGCRLRGSTHVRGVYLSWIKSNGTTQRIELKRFWLRILHEHKNSWLDVHLPIFDDRWNWTDPFPIVFRNPY